MNYSLCSKSPDDTIMFGEWVAIALHGKAVLALHGNLGSGKTCFVKGIARGLGIESVITSPTFTLIHEHSGSRPLFHVDLYRFDSVDDIFACELEECFLGEGITAVEWADRPGIQFPSSTVDFYFSQGKNQSERIIEIRNWPESAGFTQNILTMIKSGGA